MKKHFYPLLFVIISSVLSTSCSVTTNSMKEPNYHIEFYKNDFEYSTQVSGTATSIRVFGVDWKRLFSWKSGEIDSDINPTSSRDLVNFSATYAESPAFIALSKTFSVIPVIGTSSKGIVESYALHDLMVKNPGYDVIIYPQYEVVKKGIPLIFRKINVKVMARLGKIK